MVLSDMCKVCVELRVGPSWTQETAQSGIVLIILPLDLGLGCLCTFWSGKVVKLDRRN